eukprot:9596866-Ditylum_brightwellii.AAC.1
MVYIMVEETKRIVSSTRHLVVLWYQGQGSGGNRDHRPPNTNMILVGTGSEVDREEDEEGYRPRKILLLYLKLKAVAVLPDSSKQKEAEV